MRRATWKKSDHTRPFARAVKAVGEDPEQVTMYALRHSSIVRQLLAGVPIRVVAIGEASRNESNPMNRKIIATALFAAYHTGGNTTVITAMTALYPMITVVLAVTILREPFRVKQVIGLVFAAIAIVIFSL